MRDPGSNVERELSLGFSPARRLLPEGFYYQRGVMFYISEGKTPVPCLDPTKWNHWMHKEKPEHIAYDEVGTIIQRLRRKMGLDTCIIISTVFLGLDHSHSAHGAPLLFETMVFNGAYDQYFERYATWEEAERGHKRAVGMHRRPP